MGARFVDLVSRAHYNPSDVVPPSMIVSMTGFGRAEAPFGDLRVAAEIRSVNHRFCEVSARLPRFLAPYESRFRKSVQRKIARGRVDLSVVTGGDHAGKRIGVDIELARQYWEAIGQLQKEFHRSDDVPIQLLLSVARDVFISEDPVIDVGGLADHVDRLIEEAVRAAVGMRCQEGESIAADLAGRLEHVRDVLDQMAVRVPLISQEYARKLQERIGALLGGADVDENRIAQEVAIYADRCDFSEELTRIRSHMAQFAQSLAGDGAVGRTLDFLVQELNREINTIGSKANDAEVAAAVVACKSELEKIREQVQNVE